VQKLAEYVWESLKEDKELDAQIERVYVINRRSLQRLVTKGVNSFRDIYGNRIVLRFEDCGDAPCILESGTIFLSREHFSTCKEEKKDFNKILGGIIIKEEKIVEKQSSLDEFIKQTADTKPEEKRGKDLDHHQS